MAYHYQVGPVDVDRLHSEPPGHHPPHDVPEQLSGGDFLCPDHYYRLGRTCYRTSDQQLSFFGATQDCRAENGDLAIIKDPPTHRFLIELIQQTYRVGDLHYWIGLSDMLREGTFVWSDGIPLEGTTFWAIGQPNNIGAGQHCVYMYPSYDYEWVDGECSDQHYYICQQPAVNSLDQILYSHLFDIGISALGETPEGPHVAQPTPSD
ncbi:perlucin-like [Branchiostoma lanceolatum]|uniref:perlucin-like n=1 Tax=Branchiostoma lanceolatum TaxID=7740 RepID=UPI003455223A